MSDDPRATVAAKVRAAAGAEPVAWTSMAHRSYTHNGRWVVRLADGRTAFVKAAVDRLTAAWLRAEWRLYAALQASFLPRLIGWDDDGSLPVLVLEDLQDAFWPPPWTAERIIAVRTGLQTVAATPPPAGLRSLAAGRGGLAGWEMVKADPEPLLRLGLCSQAWLTRCLPALQAAADAAPLAGDALVHGDVRSDNLCIRDGQAMLVDWNIAAIGNPLFDLASWLPSLHAEGGPAPEDVVTEDLHELAALLAGYFAARAGMPTIPHAPRVREVQTHAPAPAGDAAVAPPAPNTGGALDRDRCWGGARTVQG
ncbi:MAG: phosphotransferase [Dehalococcoidia bacterium]